MELRVQYGKSCYNMIGAVSILSGTELSHFNRVALSKAGQVASYIRHCPDLGGALINMTTKFKVARIALLGVLAVFFLSAIGCGSSGESDAGSNVKPVTPKNQKVGGKRDASAFMAPS